MGSTFRSKYRALNQFEQQALDTIKAKAEEMEALFQQSVAGGREQAIAMTKLEEAVMWITKGITK